MAPQPLRVMLCGAGPRGREHIQMIQSLPDLRLVGIADVNEHSLRGLPVDSAVARSTDTARLLDQARPDLVVVATTPSVRGEIVRLVAAAPWVRAVLIEKPLAMSLVEADEMLRLCRAASVRLYVFHQLRWSPEFLRLRETIARNELGTIESVQAWCYGTLFDQGSHMVDMLGWLLPDRTAAWVAAEGCDDLKALAQQAPLHPTFARDRKHPGAAWTSVRIGFRDGLVMELGCGPLAPITRPELGPWLHKRVVVQGSAAVGEAHVASHFSLTDHHGRRLEHHRSQPGDYVNAQAAVYRSIHADLRDGSGHVDTDVDRRVVELLVACERSARTGQLETLPLDPGEVLPVARNEADLRPVRDSPRVSVLLPMGDHRGLAMPAVQSWAQCQDASPAEYELILVLSSHVAYLRPDLQPLLRENDRIIDGQGVELEQYHQAATLARGDILFFTEPHCLAEPNTVSELIRYLDHTNVDGVCARTIPICVNAMGRAESSVFDAGIAAWSRPEHWVKVIIRGFGIRRRSYEEIGGFRYRYDRFAEWLMSADLRSRGYQIDYVPEVAVNHRYGDNFGLFDQDIREFTDGESLFREECDSPSFIRDFFGHPPEWFEARSARNAPPLAVVSPLLNRVMRRAGASSPLRERAAFREAGRWLFARLLAGQCIEARFSLAVRWAQVRFWLSLTDGQRQAAFADYYTSTTSLCRIRYALRRPSSEPVTVGARADLQVTTMDERDLWGFYPGESHLGLPFRWTRSLAAIRVGLGAGCHEVSISLAGVRPLNVEREVRLFLNDRELPGPTLDESSWSLQTTIPESACAGGGTHWLTFHTERWEHPDVLSTDQRHLGLPVHAVTIMRSGSHGVREDPARLGASALA